MASIWADDMIASALSLLTSPVLRYALIGLAAWGALAWVQNLVEDRATLQQDVEALKTTVQQQEQEAAALRAGADRANKALQADMAEQYRLKALQTAPVSPKEKTDAESPIGPLLLRTLDELRPQQ
jgi:hypothetical protein